ncbi:rubrerythrin [Halobacteriales archaeon QS_8_69_26]|nr:MAG: rubrerythrin [Halobacteriales archaeon QS_8_69_26]
MSLGQRVASDRELTRLLQIGVVLEEVVEARANRHIESMSEEERAALDEEIRDLLEDAAAESADHRARLEELIDDLDADTVGYEEIEALVREHYAATSPEDFDGVLYDQLCNEETAYKFYDDLITAIEEGEAEFGIDRDRVLSTLRRIRAEEEEGVEEVTGIMERRE